MNAPAQQAQVTCAFPSPAWFTELGRLMERDHDGFARLGTIDCSMAVSIRDGAPDHTPWHVRIDFEELSVREVRLIDEAGLREVDFVIETDVATWLEMVANIAANDGRPDLAHTLNGLSLPGTPIRVWATDPLGKDMFFRYNQTLQRFVNNSVHIDSFPGAG